MIKTLFVMDALKEGFIGIILTLDTLIYGLIGSAFRVFMAIASARLLSSEAYYAIANKVYLIIGVLMLFVLSYGILKAIVNPDEGSKQLGPALLKKIAIAVVGLAVTPALFNLMYQAQGLLLEHDVLAKIFFRSENTDKIQTGGSLTVGGTTVSVDDQINPDDFVKSVGGSYTATTIWQAFFYPAPDSGLTPADITADPSDYYLKAAGWGLACGGVIGGTVAGVAYFAAANIWNPVGWILGIGAVAAVATCSLAGQNYDAAETGTAITDDEISLEQAYALTAAGESFGIYTIFLDNYLDDGEISYLFGISTLCGAFVLYAFASFSIDMGIRAAKLAYFQVIAPVPLVMQILPGKDGVFKDYTKKVIHTFLEVFIRISVVYIVIYLICHLQDLFSSVDALWGNTDLSTPELMFALAFLIIGLIIFCKDAPKFFGETLGINSGDMKLGIRDKLAKGGVYNAAGVGYGGLTTGVRNFRKGMKDGKGFGRSFMSGLAGAGSGAARAARQLIGPGHVDAKNMKDALNFGEKAAQAATDKRDARAARLKEIADGQAAIEAANREYERVVSDPTKTAADIEAAAKKRDQAIADAQNRIYHAHAAVAAIDNIGKRLDSWSTGSVSVAQEEADIKFAAGLKKLRDEARNEAFAKDDRTKKFKHEMERLQAKEISEYRDGWDEQSFSNTIQSRTNDAIEVEIARDDAAYKAALEERARKRTELTKKQAALTAATQSGDQSKIDAAVSELEIAQKDLESQELEVSKKRQEAIRALSDSGRLVEISEEVTAEVEKIAKKDKDVLDREKYELQRQIKVQKDLMEAAADDWVAEQISTKDSDAWKIYHEFLTDNVQYIKENGSRVVFDKKTVSELIGSFSTDGTSISADASKMRSFDFKPDGDTGPTINISYDSGSKTYRSSDPNYDGLSMEELFTKIQKHMDKHSSAKFEAKTASTTSSSAGKKVSEGIKHSESYQDKVRRKREESKK